MTRKRDYQIKKRWVFPEVKGKTLVNDGFSDAFLRLLAIRGIEDEKNFEAFIHPKYESLSDPFLIPDMDLAIGAVKSAIEENKKIVIYGDYDVDGVTATAVLVSFFRDLGVEAESYIPSRIDEGYGLNKEAIKYLADSGVNLIITVDCGCTSCDEIEYANTLGLKVVVTDHHTLRVENGETVLPQAAAVINPKRMKPESPLYELAGVAVAFYLARAIMTLFPEKMVPGQEKWLLDLVAMGTICDIVPLVGENRILANYGLMVLSKSRRAGLKALAKISEFELKVVDSYKVGFLLGPRLNAAGRIEHAKSSLELLLTDDTQRAEALAYELNELNLERQEITEKIVTEAAEIIENDGKGKKIYLLSGKDWPAGVVGIVASRLVEQYGRPMLVMEDQGEVLKGSARSVAGFNIIEALTGAKEHLSHFGGHAYAAGYSLPKEKFVMLNDHLLEFADDKINISEIIPEIEVDMEIEPKEVTGKFMDELALLEPLGRDNRKPIFAFRNTKIVDYRLVGNPAVHLKMTLQKDDFSLNGIAFAFGEVANIDEDSLYDLAVSLEINEWNGRKNPEFRLIDLEKSNEK